MKTFKLLSFAPLLFIILSCQLFYTNRIENIKWKEFSWDKNPSGLLYHISEKGTGKTINDTESIVAKYIWFDGKTKKQKFQGDIKGRYNSGLITGFKMSIMTLQPGGAGYFKIPYNLCDSAYYAKDQDFLLYYIKVLECPNR